MEKEQIYQKITAMVHLWQLGDYHGCYGEFFAMELDERRLIQDVFKEARQVWPARHMRKAAKGIYKLILKNFNSEVRLMTDTLKTLFTYWFDGTKDDFYLHFQILPPTEQELILLSIKEVIAGSDNEKFRQAARDIPQFIESRRTTTPI